MLIFLLYIRIERDLEFYKPYYYKESRVLPRLYVLNIAKDPWLTSTRIF